MEIKKTTLIYISNNITERDLGDEIIVMKHHGTEFHSFKDTALDIWKKAHEEITAGELSAFVVEEYGMDKSLVWKDLVNFIHDCKEKGLIHF